MIKTNRLAGFAVTACLLLSAPVYALQPDAGVESQPFLLGILVLALLAAVFLPLWNALQKSRQKYDYLYKITGQLDAGILMLLPDADFSIDFVNEGFFKLIGQADSSVQLASGFTEYVHPDDLPMFHAVVDEAKMYGGRLAVELRLKSFDGYVPTLLRGVLVEKKDARTALYCVLIDYGDHQNLLSLLNTEHERYSLVVEQSDDIIFDFDLEEGNVVTSSKYTQRFPNPPVLPDAENWSLFDEILHNEDKQKVLDMHESFLMGAEKQTCRVRLLEDGNHYRWYDIFISQISKEGVPIRYVGKLVDVHEQVLEYEWMEMKVHTDPMTGMLNKEAFYMWAEEYMIQNHESNALLFIDLDKFKQLNDTLGHMLGDRVLLDVALKIQECFRRDDLVARFGGDEFCVLAKGIAMEQVTKKAEQLIQSLQLTYTDEMGQRAAITASIGVALFPQHGTIVAQVLDCADKALYTAKENGRNQYQIYEPSMTR